jgi:hypothetical protein
MATVCEVEGRSVEWIQKTIWISTQNQQKRQAMQSTKKSRAGPEMTERNAGLGEKLLENHTWTESNRRMRDGEQVEFWCCFRDQEKRDDFLIRTGPSWFRVWLCCIPCDLEQGTKSGGLDSSSIKKKKKGSGGGFNSLVKIISKVPSSPEILCFYFKWKQAGLYFLGVGWGEVINGTTMV